MINIPANIELGIISNKGASHNTTHNNNKAWIIPDRFVFPPDFIFTIVRIVAPAPGRAPNNPEIVAKAIEEVGWKAYIIQSDVGTKIV